MASTVLSDLIVPEVFTRYLFHLTTELSALIRSGVMTRDSRIDQLLRGGGRTFQIPHFDDLANTEANVSSDAQTEATPENIGSLKDIAIRQNKNQHWGAMDLTEALSGEDVIGAIASRIAEYWVRQDQRTFMSTWKGVIASDTSAFQQTVAGTIDLGKVLDAMQVLGDHKWMFSAIVMHSQTRTKLMKNQEIITTPPNATDIGFGTYAGLTVIEDDLMETSSGAPGKEHVWLIGNNSTGYGESPPRRATEVTREALRGHGGGEEIISSRRQFAIHPYGVAFQDASVAGQSPTWAELELAANWTAVYDRKHIPFVELIVDDA